MHMYLSQLVRIKMQALKLFWGTFLCRLALPKKKMALQNEGLWQMSISWWDPLPQWYALYVVCNRGVQCMLRKRRGLPLHCSKCYLYYVLLWQSSRILDCPRVGSIWEIPPLFLLLVEYLNFEGWPHSLRPFPPDPILYAVFLLKKEGLPCNFEGPETLIRTQGHILMHSSSSLILGTGLSLPTTRCKKANSERNISI